MACQSAVYRWQTEAEKNVNQLRNFMPEKLKTFCKMHLSFILELDGSMLEDMFLDNDTKQCKKKKYSTPFSAKKKERPRNLNPVPLDKGIVFHIYQLINHLKEPEAMKMEGLFRKTGNVTRQRLLRRWISEDTAALHMTDYAFSPHDVASVLKQLLSELPEPLLTNRHYEAHIQIAHMSGHCESDRNHARDKQIKALQLMMLLLPRENAILLECLLNLLHNVSNTIESKMTSSSLGVVFSPSLLCPKTVSAEEMHVLSPIFNKAVAIMIDLAPYIFTIPRELNEDIAQFWHEMEDPNIDVLSNDEENKDNVASNRKAKYGSAAAVNTVFTFSERKSAEEFHSTENTQGALSQHYDHVQSMPESAKKKKLLKQFNHAGGVLPSSERKVKHSRIRSFGKSLKRRFAMLSKRKARYTCEKKQEDCMWSMTKAVSLDDSDADITYTTQKYTPKTTPHSPAVIIVDQDVSPFSLNLRRRHNDENLDSFVKDGKIPNVTPKTLFSSTPIMPQPVAMIAPISKSVNKMPELRRKAMMTPHLQCTMFVISPNTIYKESFL